MSVERMEMIDEFAAATVGIEEGRYRFRYQGAFATEGQYGKQNVHTLEFTELPDETIRVYTDRRMSKGSTQRNLIEAFLGRELKEDEIVSPRMLKGKEADGDVEMNKNDRPKVVRLFKIRQPVPKAVPAKAAAKTNLSAEKHIQLIEAAQGAEFDPAGQEFADWLTQSFGHGLAELTTEEADAAIESLAAGF